MKAADKKCTKCRSLAYARGVCRYHYAIFLRTGSIDLITTPFSGRIRKVEQLLPNEAFSPEEIQFYKSLPVHTKDHTIITFT